MRMSWLMAALTVFGGVCSAWTMYELPSTGESMTIPVTQPGEYILHTEGFYYFNVISGEPSDLFRADVEWVNHFSETTGWDEFLNLPGYGEDNDPYDVLVNNQMVNWQAWSEPDGVYAWHTYSPDHQYQLPIFLNGDVSLQVFSPMPENNVGALRVGIEPVPSSIPEVEMVYLFLLGGPVAFLFLAKQKNICVRKEGEK